MVFLQTKTAIFNVVAKGRRIHTYKPQILIDACNTKMSTKKKGY